jgi:putative Mg2+ transporter-C (MgtC) family protein
VAAAGGRVIGVERQWRQRIAVQMVTGIGFLGAGVSMRNGLTARRPLNKSSESLK